MLRATGLPGWMRLGYSPGRAGSTGPGLGPCAQVLLSGGNLATLLANARATAPGVMAGAAQLDKDARLNLLRARADALTQQIESLRAEISALEGDDG